MASGFEQQKQNDVRGLSWLERFGWLRTMELGRLMWPGDQFSRTRADRVVRGWLKRDLILARDLPDGAGRCLVLSLAGARLLTAAGVEAITGKDIGCTTQGEWYPPSTWRHSLIASGVLAHLFELGYTITSERQLWRSGMTLSKMPDGLAERDGTIYWIEVEQSAKQGKHLENLVEALIVLGTGGIQVGRLRATAGMVVVPASVDDRGYSINHRARITTRLKKDALVDVPVHWLAPTMTGHSVTGLAKPERELVASDLVSRIQHSLAKNGWRPAADGCGDEASYGDFIGYVWEDELHGWSFIVSELGRQGTAGQAANKTLARRGCADLISVACAR